ncbi:MAG TPA: SRPBCC family protein, partial [Stellaceae bacterium]|nr:SRPBCC family protein [Stellaceae bacterium]
PALEREREGPVAERREGEGAREGWTRIDENFVIAAPPETVWAALTDFPKVAACLPGAELIEHDQRSVRGLLRVKLGPMAASFAGSATVQRDDTAMTGIARGAGTDSGSRSRTRGELSYSLTPGSGGQQTRVAVAVHYDLQGPLAQFSRSNLARDFAARVVAEFAANLNRALGAGGMHTDEEPRALNLAALIWSVVWGRVKALLGRTR